MDRYANGQWSAIQTSYTVPNISPAFQFTVPTTSPPDSPTFNLLERQPTAFLKACLSLPCFCLSEAGLGSGEIDCDVWFCVEKPTRVDRRAFDGWDGWGFQERRSDAQPARDEGMVRGEIYIADIVMS